LPLLRDDPAETARLHGALRFAVGTTLAFGICEAMAWPPAFLAPVFACLLLGGLPVALSPKMGLGLMIMEGVGAYAAFGIASMFQHEPVVQFGIVGIFLFIFFGALAHGRNPLVIVLTLISFTVVPVETMAATARGMGAALGLTRGMVVAVVAVWVVQVLWPARASAPEPVPMRGFDSPLSRAIAGTLIVLPVMLVYQMYSLTDAIPVLSSVIVIVTTLDAGRGVTKSVARMAACILGGFAGILAVLALTIAPHLVTLCLIVFLLGAFFAPRILAGGTDAVTIRTAYIQAVIVFGHELTPGGDAGLWLSRFVQFAIACIFAVGMMALLMPRAADHEGELPETI